MWYMYWFKQLLSRILCWTLWNRTHKPQKSTEFFAPSDRAAVSWPSWWWILGDNTGGSVNGGTPMAGWMFIVDKFRKIDDLGVPPF